MARPTMLPEVEDDLLKALNNGATIVDACAVVGIDQSTYHIWYSRGKGWYESDEMMPEHEDIYFEFFKKATRARAMGRIRSIGTIQKAIQEGDVHAAQWYLARTDPDNWADQSKRTIDININTGVLNKVIARLKAMDIDPDTFFQRALDQLERQQLPETISVEKE